MAFREDTGQEGLAISVSGAIISMCESENTFPGFRRITYYLDRPDVLSKFTVRVQADARKFPVLLSNGNLQITGKLLGGQHFVEYEVRLPSTIQHKALQDVANCALGMGRGANRMLNIMRGGI